MRSWRGEIRAASHAGGQRYSPTSRAARPLSQQPHEGMDEADVQGELERPAKQRYRPSALASADGSRRSTRSGEAAPVFAR